jgi:hypothetical protein
MAGTDAVVLASCTVLLPTTGVGGGGAGALPGTSCAMARFCCNCKILGKIANSTATILNTIPKEDPDFISYHRERELYKRLSLIGAL